MGQRKKRKGKNREEKERHISTFLSKDRIDEEYIEDKRRKNPDTGYLFDPELGNIRIECPSLENGKWFVDIEKDRNFDTIIILCTDEDIRKSMSSIIRVYRIPEFEIGDMNCVVICEDISVNSEWEKFRDNDVKKYNDAYSELKRNDMIPVIDDLGIEDHNEDSELGGLFISDIYNSDDDYSYIYFDAIESTAIVGTIYGEFSGSQMERDEIESIFDKKCCRCMISEVYTKEFLKRVKMSIVGIESDRSNVELSNDDKKLILSSMYKLEEFLSGIKNELVHIEDSNTRNKLYITISAI